MIPRSRIVTIKIHARERPRQGSQSRTRRGTAMSECSEFTIEFSGLNTEDWLLNTPEPVRGSSTRFRYLALAISTALVLCGCTPHGPRELLQGKKLIERAKYTQAREKLVRATGILKTNANAWNYLGVASQHAGDSAEAEKAYQRALLIDHDLSEAHFNLGCLYLEQNRATAARNELTAFCLRRADSLDGLLMLGLAQLRCRDGAAAEKTFSDALRLSPDHAEALNGLGLARLQRGKPAEALAFFATALKVQPKYAPALLNCAIVYQGYVKDNRAAL